MEIIIATDEAEGTALAARQVARAIKEKPDAVLGLATGRTPMRLYAELARLHAAGGLDFSAVTTFNLDEYVGLAASHPASFHAFMQAHLFDRVNLEAARTHIPNGAAIDIAAECQAYEDSIARAGGIDLQILGIGTDGHLGFNEPSSSLGSRTRIKTLTAQTRHDNAGAFGSAGAVPSHVITMGVGTIMAARRCLLLAFGSRKATAVAGALEGPITAMVPASALQWHRDVRIILDGASGERLAMQDYYRQIYRDKPAWQRD